MKNAEDIKKYRAMKEADLLAEINKAEREQTLASLKVKAGKEADLSCVSKKRKNIARMKTILTEKQIGVNNG